MAVKVILIRLLVASILGGLIGLERERHGRPAGFRTHLLVALGSALTMLVSLRLYDLFKIYSTSNYASGVDPSRIASMVMAGIGFLGAGTIIQSRGSIWGLTTAACLWVTAGLGLSIGCGFYAPAIIATIISLIALLLLKKPVERCIKKDWYYRITIKMADGKDAFDDIRRALIGYGSMILKVDFNKHVPQSKMSYIVSIRLRKVMCQDLIESLARIAGVERVITD